MALFVDIHPHIAIVRAGDRTHPRIGLVLPGVVCVPWLVVDFDEGLPLVELPKHLQELRPGYWLSRKASADIDNAAHNGDIARREVHAHTVVGYRGQFLLHLIRMPVAHNIVQYHVPRDLWMMNGAGELRPCPSGAGETIHNQPMRLHQTGLEEGGEAENG